MPVLIGVRLRGEEVGALTECRVFSVSGIRLASVLLGITIGHSLGLPIFRQYRPANYEKGTEGEEFVTLITH
jgi:hypothetical protein